MNGFLSFHQQLLVFCRDFTIGKQDATCGEPENMRLKHGFPFDLPFASR